MAAVDPLPTRRDARATDRPPRLRAASTTWPLSAGCASKSLEHPAAEGRRLPGAVRSAATRAALRRLLPRRTRPRPQACRRAACRMSAASAGLQWTSAARSVTWQIAAALWCSFAAHPPPPPPQAIECIGLTATESGYAVASEVLDVPNFAVSFTGGACAAFYEGTPKAEPCSAGEEYTLSGCTLIEYWYCRAGAAADAKCYPFGDNAIDENGAARPEENPPAAVRILVLHPMMATRVARGTTRKAGTTPPTVHFRTTARRGALTAALSTAAKGGAALRVALTLQPRRS